MKNNVSQALIEVWNWKDQAYHEVEQLPIEQALRKRLEDSLRLVRQLGMTVSDKVERKEWARVAHQ